MGAPQTGDASQKQHRRGIFPRWLRPITIILAVIFFVICGGAWIWNVWGHISDVMAAIFAILAAICTFFAMPILYPSHDDNTLNDAQQPPLTPVLAPPPVQIYVNQQQAVGTSLRPPGLEPLSAQTPLMHATITPVEPIALAPPTQAVKPALTDVPHENAASLQAATKFIFNEPLTDPKEFYGRSREWNALLNRTRNRASTSIIGPRRIGKTWLMTYMKLVAPTELGDAYHIGYLDASLPLYNTVAGFTVGTLDALGLPFPVDTSNTGLGTLQKVVEKLVTKQQIAVLCIDEFEYLKNGQEFNLNFFAGLRAISQIGMVVVTASKIPLIQIVSGPVASSPFFNVFQQLRLRPFTEKQAGEFALAKSAQAGFTAKERDYLLEYSKENMQEWPPLRLQLVGKLLLEDKMSAQEDPESYRPESQSYWRKFEQRLEEEYEAVIGR